MKKRGVSFRTNANLARKLWGELSQIASRGLRDLTERHSLSVAAGDIQFLSGRWYVTHSGLLRLALRRGCHGIETILQEQCSDHLANRWVFKAVVYKKIGSNKFEGYGDADPSNVSSLVQGAELRIAETRAVNRALRKAYGIGLCSVEELGGLSGPSGIARDDHSSTAPLLRRNSDNGQVRLKDRFCLLVRQNNLDPTLVKAYAADFCGTETLKGASRDLIESFLAHLAKCAKENRDSLLCKLNSYARPGEANP